MKSIKLSVFADLHHYPECFYSEAPKRLDYILNRATKENVDAIISLGDFCHIPRESKDLIDKFNNFSIPAFHVSGNHDYDQSFANEVRELYNMPNFYYHKDINNFRLIFIDTSYVKIDNTIVHFENGNYLKHRTTREILPQEELDYLEKTIFNSPYPCILFSHASFERESKCGVINYLEIREIIKKANAKHKHKVLLAINGHHHRDFLRIFEDVAYFDLNSTSFDWLDNPHDLFPEELIKKHSLVNHTVVYNDPIHAIITIRENGTIKIAGMKSSFFMGISRGMTNNSKCDEAGRVCNAEVLSAKLSI